MFGERTALYLQAVYPGVEKDDQEERRILVLDWQIQPFKPEMAEELGVAGNLFARKDGEPLSDLINITLAISAPLQQIEMRMAPDAGDASCILRQVEIDPKLTVRRDKEGPVLCATLSMSVRYPAPDDMLFLMNSYRQQRWLTMTPEQGNMLTDGAEAPRRGRKKKAEEPAADEPGLPMAGGEASTVN